MELSVDELARLAKTTVRNLRAYQDRGLLPPPHRRGRRGVYTDAHLARTRLILQLLERGYSLGNIAELIRAWEGGRDLHELLGIESAVATPFSTEPPQELDERTVLAGVGNNPELLAASLELGLLERTGNGFRVPSPRTLQAGMALIAAGVPWRDVIAILRTIRDDLEHLATNLIAVVVEHLLGGRGSSKLPKGADTSQVGASLWRLRPLAEDVVRAELARALEAAVQDALGQRLDRVLATLKPKRRATGTRKRPIRADR